MYVCTETSTCSLDWIQTSFMLLWCILFTVDIVLVDKMRKRINSKLESYSYLCP